MTSGFPATFRETLNGKPGLNPRRLIRLMEAAIDRCHLDLRGQTVLTEAASGAYVVTPVLAAMAGAQVLALAATTSYATSDELRDATTELARLVGMADRIQLIEAKSPAVVGAPDIVTNSGQVRPIDAVMIAQMKPSAVITLMYESWEFRPADLDLDACRHRRIPVAGTNENHPAVDVLASTGNMAIKQLHDAGIAVYGSRIVLLCDNSFASFIARTLRNVGADVVLVSQLTAEALTPPCDAVLLALTPKGGVQLNAADVMLIRGLAEGAVIVQYWGDADRAAIAAAQVPVWPAEAPRAGHMGVLPSAIGPEPVVRLQAGGLKVGELLARGLDRTGPEDRLLVQLL
jgi:hypothetical protein